MLLILGNLSFPGTLNFIGELFSIVSIGNIDYSFMRLVLLNVLLTSCYSFFTMSIVYLIGQAEIYEYYKDTNRIESSFIFLLFGIIGEVNWLGEIGLLLCEDSWLWAGGQPCKQAISPFFLSLTYFID